MNGSSRVRWQDNSPIGCEPCISLPGILLPMVLFIWGHSRDYLNPKSQWRLLFANDAGWSSLFSKKAITDCVTVYPCKRRSIRVTADPLGARCVATVTSVLKQNDNSHFLAGKKRSDRDVIFFDNWFLKKTRQTRNNWLTKILTSSQASTSRTSHSQLKIFWPTSKDRRNGGYVSILTAVCIEILSQILQFYSLAFWAERSDRFWTWTLFSSSRSQSRVRTVYLNLFL